MESSHTSPPARLSRRVRHLTTTVALGAVGALTLTTVSASAASPRDTPSNQAVLAANGIAGVDFGTPEAAAIQDMTAINPVPVTDTSLLGCGIDQQASGTGLVMYFGDGAFVGYSVGAGSPLSTTEGLTVGDTVEKAQSLYGSAFDTTLAQGGAWGATTSVGTLDGFLQGAPPITDSTPIATIEAGNVGCAAARPWSTEDAAAQTQIVKHRGVTHHGVTHRGVTNHGAKHHRGHRTP